MVSRRRQLGVRLSCAFSTMTALAAVVMTAAVMTSPREAAAQADGTEVICVEPLNRPVMFDMMNQFWLAPTVARRETVCGNPAGDPNKFIACYEFAVTYITYDDSGNSILHLPECNGASNLAPDCEDHNLCAEQPGVLKAPICGDIQAVVEELTSPGPLTLGPQPKASWDGTSVTVPYQTYIGANSEGVVTVNTYRVPIVRMPRSIVEGFAGVPLLGFLEGRHVNLDETNVNYGFFSVLHRLFTYQELTGDLTNTDATPLFFQR
jgi:hypothetical protein